jgi:AbrB family transcriptional regulator, transcriptional pleiotropic regulator of transition state genes
LPWVILAEGEALGSLAKILTVSRFRGFRTTRERRSAMHDTGIVRRVDDLGRIVIPMELRRTLGIKVKDPMAIYVEGERIILSKHKDACSICGVDDVDVVDIKGRPVCVDCVTAIKRS